MMMKRANDKIQNDKFVQSIIKGGVNIFDEIRKYRGKRYLSSLLFQNPGRHFLEYIFSEK